MPHGAATSAPSGKEQYAAGHIPGAVALDYAEDLHDLATPYAAPPSRRPSGSLRFMGANGIGDDTFVVAYDAGDVPYGARMVWMLRYYGHDAVRDLGRRAAGLAGRRSAGHHRRAALSAGALQRAHAADVAREP